MVWRPLAVTIRSHQVDSLAATPVASVVRLAADLRLERSASGLTVRFPHPVGLSARIRIGAECGNRTRLICLEGRGPKPLDQPRPIGGLCVSLYGSPSPCDGSLRAPDFGRGFSGGLRARDPRSSYLSAPGLAPEARPIRTLSRWFGVEISRPANATTTGYSSLSRHAYRVNV